MLLSRFSWIEDDRANRKSLRNRQIAQNSRQMSVSSAGERQSRASQTVSEKLGFEFTGEFAKNRNFRIVSIFGGF